MQQKNIYTGRVNALDLYRGIALACVVFFHAVIFNYGGLHLINLQDPPLIVTLIGMMGLWGGIFIILSLVTSSLSILRVLAQPQHGRRAFLYIVIASIAYLVLHYILTIFLGRWELNPSVADNKMTVTAELIRNYHLALPSLNSLFDGSILSTIGLNLLLIGTLVYVLFRKPSRNNEKRAYVVLGGLAVLMSVVSFSRVELYPLVNEAVASNHHVRATLLGWVVGFPYPIISYGLYGLIGAIVGIMVHHNRLNLIRRIVFPLGLAIVSIGIVGCFSQPTTFNKPDMFWQWKTVADLGIFLLLLVFALGIVQPRQNGLQRFTIFLWISRISLTIYLLETTTSELLRNAWSLLIPAWDQSMISTLLFGLFNILWWFAVVYLWSRIDFKYSLEYFWVKLFGKLGKISTKLDNLQSL